jgi:hypothetical protein
LSGGGLVPGGGTGCGLGGEGKGGIGLGGGGGGRGGFGLGGGGEGGGERLVFKQINRNVWYGLVDEHVDATIVFGSITSKQDPSSENTIWPL